MQDVASRVIKGELTAVEVKAFTTPGFYPDSRGLYFQVQKAGQRSWIHRYTLRGRTRDMGLGGYPAVSLAEARRRRDTNRAFLAQQIDPLDAKRAAEPARHNGPTSREVAEAHITTKLPEWSSPKHAAQWTATMTAYAYPTIGSKKAHDVSIADTLAILTPIWKTRHVTATHVRCRIEAILASASVREGWADYDNPAVWRGRLSHLLAAPKRIHQVQNHPALPYGEMAGFKCKLRQVDAVGACAGMDDPDHGADRHDAWRDLGRDRLANARMDGASGADEEAQGEAKELICSPQTGSFLARVFRASIPWLDGAENDEGVEVFGRAEGVHFEAKG